MAAMTSGETQQYTIIIIIIIYIRIYNIFYLRQTVSLVFFVKRLCKYVHDHTSFQCCEWLLLGQIK